MDLQQIFGFKIGFLLQHNDLVRRHQQNAGAGKLPFHTLLFFVHRGRPVGHIGEILQIVNIPPHPAGGFDPTQAGQLGIDRAVQSGVEQLHFSNQRRAVFVGVGDDRHIVHRDARAFGRGLVVIAVGVVHRAVDIGNIHQIRHIVESGQLALRLNLTVFVQHRTEIIGFGVVKAVVLKHIPLLFQQPEKPLMLAIHRANVNVVAVLHRQNRLVQQAHIQPGFRRQLPADKHRRQRHQKDQRDHKIPLGFFALFHFFDLVLGLLLLLARRIKADILFCGGVLVHARRRFRHRGLCVLRCRCRDVYPVVVLLFVH